MQVYRGVLLRDGSESSKPLREHAFGSEVSDVEVVYAPEVLLAARSVVGGLLVIGR